MRKFTEVLEEYLKERDRQNSNYYDNRYVADLYEGRYHMNALAKELDEMVQRVE